MLTPSHSMAYPSINFDGRGAIVMKAKFYERDDRPGHWVVWLSWKGKLYRRHHYNNEMSLIHEEMARQVAGAINAGISQKGASFDPRQWFKTPGYEFEFDQYASKWLSRQTHYAPSVKRDVQRYAGMAIEFFDRRDIRELRKADLKDFLEWLPQHLSAKTKKNVLTVLHKLFADAYDEELLPRIPGFPKIEVAESEIKWIPREWQDKILGEIPEVDRPIFTLIRTWGVRPGEARALMWDCVDFDKEIITIKRTFSGAGCNHLQEFTKTRRIRYLPFTDELKEVFHRIRGIGGFVFRNQRGRPYTADLSRIWNQARERAGCPQKVMLYQGTRHSFATQHLDKLDIVRQVLGHTRTEMTRRYQAINVEKMKQLIH